MKTGTIATAHAAIALSITATILTGCAPSVDPDDFTERFAIEMAGIIGEREDWVELGASMADSAAEGYCSSDAFRSALSDEALIYAWDVACVFYYEHEMSEYQLERANQSILERTLQSVQD